MVEYQLPKLTTRVRFPSSAPEIGKSACALANFFSGADAVYDRTRRICLQMLQLPPTAVDVLFPPKSASSLLVSGKAQNIRASVIPVFLLLHSAPGYAMIVMVEKQNRAFRVSKDAILELVVRFELTTC